jgi:hypothetical protein
VDLDVLRFWLFGDKDVREEDGESEENDNGYQALTQPALGSTHPLNALIFLFLGTP